MRYSGRGNLAGEWEDQSSARSALEFTAESDDAELLAQELLQAVDAAGVAIVHEERGSTGSLLCVVSVGHSVPAPGTRLDPDSGISGQCIRERRTLCCYDAGKDPRVERAVSEQLGIASLVAAPLMAGSRCIGLIEAVSQRIGHFDQARRAMVERAADRATALLERLPQQAEPLPVDAALRSTCEEPDGAHSCSTHSNGILLATPATGTLPNSLRGTWRPPSKRAASALLLFVIAALIITVVGFRAWRKHSGQLRTQSSYRGAAPTGAALTVIPDAQENHTVATAPSMVKTHPEENAALPALSKEADRGVRSAQMKLAQTYLEGKRLARDPVSAAAWYIIAGENGSPEAKRRSIEITRRMSSSGIGKVRFDVGRMYMNGRGAHKDDIAAYAWFELARAAGERRAERAENQLRAAMKEADVETARRRAAGWLRSHSVSPRPGDR